MKIFLGIVVNWMGSPKESPSPWIDKEDIRSALSKMKVGKAAGVSGIAAEIFTDQRLCEGGEGAK
jgi:hypothetical protein